MVPLGWSTRALLARPGRLIGRRGPARDDRHRLFPTRGAHVRRCNLAMSNAVITVEEISKRYILGRRRSKDDGFRHVIEDALRAPLKWLRFRNQQHRQEREEFWALKNVSFEIMQGEVVGIIGRNGAGKSTLLKILSRITEPTSGRISIDGRVASLLEVGTGFHPELTGRENIFLNGAILGMSRVEISRKFDEIVAFSEVEKFLDTPVKRYSSGMYVRLAFAVAAHLEPDILIVDEVLAVGDAQFQQKCLGKIQNIARETGRTVLLVSHNLESIRRLCSSCIWLRGGVLQKHGATNEIVGQYVERQRTRFNEISLEQQTRGSWLRQRAKFEKIKPFESIDQGWSFQYGEHLKFIITFRIYADIQELMLGYAVNTLSGFEIAAAKSSLTKFGPFAPGLYELHFSLPKIRFAPHSFTLTLGLDSESGGEDHLSEVITFDILPNVRSATEFTDKMRAVCIADPVISIKS